MISPKDSLVDKMDYYDVCANIDILATQALFAMKFSPYSQDKGDSPVSV